MLLSEFFNHLSFGELSQYSIGTDDTGQIPVKDYPRIVSFLNLALTRLHTRLPLRMESVEIQTSVLRDTYRLRSKFARSNMPIGASLEDYYILDETNPFKDNVLVINEVLNELGESLPIGDSLEDEGVVLPDQLTVVFDYPLDQITTVTYQANHPAIPMSKRIDPDAIEVNVPDFCLEPLLVFCAAKVIGGGGNAEAVQEGQMKMQMFELLVSQLRDSGVVRTATPTTQRHRPYGWV